MYKLILIATLLAACMARAFPDASPLMAWIMASAPTPPPPPVEATPFLWLDATDTSTITTNSSGRVSAWNSVSPATNNATQTTEANRPYWHSSVINGKAAIETTESSTQYMQVFPFHIKPLTIVAVVRFTTGKEGVILSGAEDGSYYSLWWWGSDGSFFTLQNEDIISDPLPVNGNYLLVWAYDGSTVNLRVNGQDYGAVNVDYEAADHSYIMGSSYAGVVVGSQAHYGEMRAFDSILPLAQIEAIEAELTTKWGL